MSGIHALVIIMGIAFAALFGAIGYTDYTHRIAELAPVHHVTEQPLPKCDMDHFDINKSCSFR